MSTMKAIRFHGNQDLRLDQVPVAEVGADQVKIAPEWCGLCGSGKREMFPRNW
jgi:threonine dehydrogenase-like Zn-dependent dehydrogenase